MEVGVALTTNDYVPINLPNVKKDLYLISSDGKIYSKYKKGILIPKVDKDGYLALTLRRESNEEKPKDWKIHQLVALVYIGNPPQYLNDPTVDHIDGNKNNNHYSNLRWIERNVNSSIRKNKGVGENNHEAVLTEKQVIEISELLVQKKYTLKQIGDMYGVHKSTISNIKRKKNWVYLTKYYDFNEITMTY